MVAVASGEGVVREELLPNAPWLRDSHAPLIAVAEGGKSWAVAVCSVDKRGAGEWGADRWGRGRAGAFLRNRLPTDTAAAPTPTPTTTRPPPPPPPTPSGAPAVVMASRITLAHPPHRRQCTTIARQRG